MIDEDLKKMEEQTGFFKHNNFHIVEADKDNVIIKAEITDNSLNPYGIVHGGIIYSLGDVTLGLITYLTERAAVTLTSSINYLKPGTGKYLTCKGELIKAGRSTAYLRAYIYNDKEEMIATMDGTYFYIKD